MYTYLISNCGLIFHAWNQFQGWQTSKRSNLISHHEPSFLSHFIVLYYINTTTEYGLRQKRTYCCRPRWRIRSNPQKWFLFLLTLTLSSLLASYIAVYCDYYQRFVRTISVSKSFITNLGFRSSSRRVLLVECKFDQISS